MAPPPAMVVPAVVWGLEMGRIGGTKEVMMVLEREWKGFCGCIDTEIVVASCAFVYNFL